MIPLCGVVGVEKAFFGTASKSLVLKLQKKGKLLNREMKSNISYFSLIWKGIQNSLNQTAQQLYKLYCNVYLRNIF